MARIRSVKPEFWDDEDLALLPLGCRLMFIGTWNFADDNGVIRASEKYIKSKIFPYDDIRLTEIKKWIDALEKARYIIPISYKNESYYIIRTFNSHQKTDTRYAKYIIPNEVIENHLVTNNTVNTPLTPREHVAGEDRSGGDSNRSGGSPPPLKKSLAELVFEENENSFSARIFELWIKLCEQKKWRNKERAAIEMSFKKLTNYKEEFAADLLENAISGSYQGVVFSDTDEKYEKWLNRLNGNNGKQTTNYGKQPTGSEVDIQSGLNRLASMYRPADK